MDPAKLYDELDYSDCINDSDLSLLGISLPLADIQPGFITPEPETMDIGVKLGKFPYSPRGPPESNSYPGELNFFVEVNSNDVHKKTFRYSHRLNCIYVDMKCNFSVHFAWDYMKAPHMFIRATVVFSDKTQAEKRVERCVQHLHESSIAGIPKEIAKNVLRSTRDLGTQGVYYCGQVDTADSWYSVLVEFTRTSPDPCTHAYQFMCKNSCTTGINRRAIAIIFTLEDGYGQVYGRQRVGARVCSCTKRDMIRDEIAEGVYETGKKRIPSNQIAQPKSKKIKVENLTDVDETVVQLPPLKIVGCQTVVTGLNVMKDMMEQAAKFRQGDADATALYAKHIADLKDAIEKMDTSKTPPQ